MRWTCIHNIHRGGHVVDGIIRQFAQLSVGDGSVVEKLFATLFI
jgi:hypothetical protein